MGSGTKQIQLSTGQYIGTKIVIQVNKRKNTKLANLQQCSLPLNFAGTWNKSDLGYHLETIFVDHKSLYCKRSPGLNFWAIKISF